jgi:hypothetical protein
MRNLGQHSPQPKIMQAYYEAGSAAVAAVCGRRHLQNADGARACNPQPLRTAEGFTNYEACLEVWTLLRLTEGRILTLPPIGRANLPVCHRSLAN